MTDAAIDVIRGAINHKITYQWLRSRLRADHGLKESLNFGHAVIDTVPKLDQYLHSYGPMIESQWEHAAAYLGGISPPTNLIDYGCGQGLAGLLVNDFQDGLLDDVRQVLLIEPSGIALARAAAVYVRIAQAAEVTSVCKRFDELSDSDLPSWNAGATLHLFSNSLDVLGFAPLTLLSTTMQAGHHIILSVSHDRDFNGGTPRIESVKAAFEDPLMATDLTIQRSSLTRFTCNNPSQSKGLVWFCELEVHDG